MEIIGRVTADAQRKALNDGREVVHFSIAINDTYKPRGAAEAKKITTFVECSYWINPGIAQYLTKGTLVQLSGNIAARAYQNMDGEPKASLTFHVNTVKLHGGSKARSINAPEATEQEAAVDMPF